MVSVIIPNRNRANLLGECLDSIIDQTYKDFEVLVVDDGSSDDSFEVFSKRASGRSNFIWVRRERPPQGAPTCRNIGLEMAKGEFVMFLDSDDLIQPFCLHQRTSIFRQFPEYDFHVFQVVRFQEGKEEVTCWNELTQEDDLERFLKLDSVWHTMSPIWRRATLLDKGLLFDEQLTIWQDVDFHANVLNMGLNYKVHFSQPADALYRVHKQGSISQQAYTLIQRLSQWYFVKKNFRKLKHNANSRNALINLSKQLVKRNLEVRNYLLALRIQFWLISKRILIEKPNVH